ncbi:MAG TPA: hypothetical protein VH062_35470 [Polyangiaceae bacterium]|nr:hypothetical protein [Polyangiaceae bacterium]
MRIELLFLFVPLLAGCSSKPAASARHGDTDAGRDAATPAITTDASNDAAPSARTACASNGSGPLVTEAGFIDVPAGAVSLLYAERLFYSFHPADAQPEKAPLLVFVNGGPTTEVLLPYGTGPRTLDPDAPSTAPPRPNPNTYTRFANLLYLDQRDLGFSYATEPIRCGDAPTKESITTASDLVFAALAFLDGHPALRANPVAFVGESFGGALASVAVHMTQVAATASSVIPDLSLIVPWLTDRLRQHGASAFSGCADESTQR